jgi:hypothetical protein
MCAEVTFQHEGDWTHVSLVKRVLAVLAFALTLGLLANTISAATLNLSAKLLSIDQMPTGWAVDNSPVSSAKDCVNKLLLPKGIKRTASAGEYFDDDGNVPTFEEKLATFSGSASNAFDKMISSANACKNFTAGGHKFTMGQMSFAHYGNQSAAYTVSGDIQGESIGEDFLIVREGSVIAAFAEADLQPVSTDLSQFEGLVVKALAKLSRSVSTR